MSQITLSANTWAGNFENDIIAASVLNARAVEAGWVTIHPNVDEKKPVITVDTAVTVQDGAAAFNAAGSETIDEIVFDLGKFMINRELDYSNLDGNWLSQLQPRGRAGDFEAPASLEDALNMHFAGKASVFTGASIWRGTTLAGAELSGITQSGSESVTGIVDGLLADSAVNDIDVAGTYKQTITAFSKAADAVITVADTSDYRVGDFITFGAITGSSGANWSALSGTSVQIKSIPSGTTLTIETDTSGYTGTFSAGTLTCINKNNVIDALEAVYDNLSDLVRLQPDLALVVDTRVGAAYRQAQANAAVSPAQFARDYELNFLGLPVYEDPAMRKNCIIGYRVSNLHFATPLISDLNQVLIVNQRDTTASRTIRYRLDWAFDVKHSNGTEFTLLS